MRTWAIRAAILAGLVTITGGASALEPSEGYVSVEPWVDPDPPGPPTRYALGDFGIAPDAEYRAQYSFVNPIDLNSETRRRFNLIEHRGRFGTTVDWDKKVKLTVSLDLLDGVLYGDNGTFATDVPSDSGLQATARDPNVVKPCIAPTGEGDPLKPDGYGWALCQADHVKVRRLFGQVNTPIGAIRVGRQPVGVGQSVQTTTGDGRRNRWGAAYEGDSVDRVMFATKPLEALKPPDMRDTSETKGLIVAVIYDRWVSDQVTQYSDDVNQIAWALRYVNPDIGIGKNLEAQFFHAHRWNPDFNTIVNTIGGRLFASFEGFTLGGDIAANIGSTREVSEGYSLISNDPVMDQEILQLGARAVARYDVLLDGRDEKFPFVTGYLEFDYASGDGDPRPGTPLSQFRFSEDTNVGLLLFDHVVRYQSARASRAGVEILRRLGASTYAAERIDTRGAFTGAMALFPQMDFRPHEDLLVRGGVMFAWGPEPVIDQVGSLQADDGTEIADDLVNFVGGKPGDYYGTEVDFRFSWRFMDHFLLDLEAAVLFPGDALQDENGQAANSFLTQARTHFYF